MDTTLTQPSSGTALSLPAGFRWGVATAAYQIEGAAAEDGRTPSIWDTYSHTPGQVHGDDNGDVACDHYHRMPDDVALIKGLGVDTYRFSISWPRVQPGGSGRLNPKGVDFYSRLVDELLANDVDPWVTLYHWDLPQELEDAGGWPARDTAHRFADYAALMFDQLSDRVTNWTTLNEPWCSAMLGYAYGHQAPGHRDFPAGIRAVHHLLLGHGLATQRMREAATGLDRPVHLGITLNLGPAHPATDTDEDREAARRADGLNNRLYLDPLLKGAYPADVMDDVALRQAELPVQEGDLEIISTPIDVLGVNYYTGWLISHLDEDGSSVDSDGALVARSVGRGRPATAMGWEIVPEVFTELLLRLSREYPGVPLFITENGAAFDDVVAADGSVPDPERQAYLESHIHAVQDAVVRGADVRGYFVWSLLDNFEWSYGYDKRFGIVRVDYKTQERTLKDSAHWLRGQIRVWRESVAG
ncbi:GH1 family beta-glucosidase [Kineosporia sp. NBRC 101731]|uniref:GH1 family beta-glucosidase n=1 Tax=Kineosporia sp. NBRC 101731 TaxID=3032199 RepID=UPI0024A346AF|nr:GH1 family beta-glucosidase [Kineosporia sp. NBRC 101731]GLY28068.1 beta-glucosidase [Kineosporia sp. NBRC 101731]